jgi:hypothetical protein
MNANPAILFKSVSIRMHPWPGILGLQGTAKLSLPHALARLTVVA